MSAERNDTIEAALLAAMTALSAIREANTNRQEAISRLRKEVEEVKGQCVDITAGQIEIWVKAERERCARLAESFEVFQQTRTPAGSINVSIDASAAMARLAAVIRSEQ